MKQRILFLCACLILLALIDMGCSGHVSTDNAIDITETKTVSPPQATMTMTPSQTPYPTQLVDIALPTILGLYKDNGGCVLPCWWGIVPGESSWQTVFERFSLLADIQGPYKHQNLDQYVFVFVLPEEIDPFGNLKIPGVAPGTKVGIWVEGGTVKAISVGSYFVTHSFDYSLSGLLKEFGQPEEIWLDARSTVPEPGGQPSYDLKLFYPQKGILVSLNGNVEIQQDSLRFCPQNLFTRGNYPPGLLLWSPTTLYKFTEISTRLLPGITFWSSDRYLPLEEWTGEFTVRNFYSTYVQPNTSTCLTVRKLP